jgi:cytochrome c2
VTKDDTGAVPPGAAMTCDGLNDGAERTDVIAFLKGSG